MKFFLRTIQDTAPGKRFRRAWREQEELGRHLLSWKGGSDESRYDLQRLYIQQCDEASTALAVLNRLHSWPEAYPHNDFTYHPPPKPTRRRARKGL